MCDIKFNESVKYKELCNMFGEEPKVGGRNKSLQIKKWQKEYEIIKNGMYYTILRELSEEEKAITYNSGKYQKHMEDFLILYLSREAMKGNTSCVLTNRNILEMSSMINLDYFKAKNYFQKYMDSFEIYVNEKDIPCNKTRQDYELSVLNDAQHIFFSASYRLLKRIIENSLKTFEKSSLILKNKTFVCYRSHIIDKKRVTEVYKCDDKMIKRILSVQSKSMQEFNLLMKEKYGDDEHYLKDFYRNVLLPYEDKKHLKAIVDEYFYNEFKEEGFTAYGTAWDIKLADGVCFQHELESRNFDWKILNNNVMDKLDKAKDLKGIKQINRQFILKFIKCYEPVHQYKTQIAIEYEPNKNEEDSNNV